MGRKFSLARPKSKNLERKKYASRASVPSLKSLAKTIENCLPRGWVSVYNPAIIVVAKSIFAPGNSQKIVTVSVIIDVDFTWSIRFPHGLVQGSSSDMFKDVPSTLPTSESVVSLLCSIDHAKRCTGNSDAKFHTLREFKKGLFLNKRRTTPVAFVDSDLALHPTSTIRTYKCEVLVPPGITRCPVCTKHRPVLRVLMSRHRQANPTRRDDPRSRVNDRWRTTPELRKTLHSLRRLRKVSNQKIRRLKAKVEDMIHKEGTQVDDSTHGDLLHIMENCSQDISSKYPTNSFPQLFWNQQLVSARLTNSKSMRWHPLMIRWCLYLHHLSGKGYQLLRESGGLSLPSQRTLREYSHYNSTKIGFSAVTDQDLVRIIMDYDPWQKMVIVTMDEMYIREEVIYDKYTGQITGFTDMGDVTNHLMRIERNMNEDREVDNLAKTVFVFLVRGLCSSLEYPYAQFACKNLKADSLYRPVTEAISRLERIGLKVMGLTADGAATNSCLFSLLSPPGTDQRAVYKIPNPYTDEKRNIFFSDPPHLLKTIRNCFANRKRQLCINGENIRWSFIEQLYHKDTRAGGNAAELRMLPKLKYEHVYLNSFSKMRVDLAAQVMSQSVSKALECVIGADSKATANFIDIVDKMFDCLNVRNLTDGKKSRKTFQAPYRSGRDFRLQWLEETCLPYFSNWEKSVLDSITSVTKAQKRKLSEAQKKEMVIANAAKKNMLLSQETMNGIFMTVRSFVELVRYLFEVDGVKFFLSEHICQDPLEKFFGCQRQRGRPNENPNLGEFYKNTQALRVIGSVCRDSVKGNCRGAKRPSQTIDCCNEEPLPKRKRVSKQ